MINLRNAAGVIIALIAILSSAGCATIVTGTWQKVPVSSEPDGAAVSVDGSTYTTPITIKLKRDADHVLVFTKDQYKPQEVKLLHVISGAFCGNVFLGGPLGMGIDALTGAQYKLLPLKVHAVMQKAE